MRSGEAGCDLAENRLRTLEWETEGFGCVGETNGLAGAMPGVPVRPDARGEVLTVSSGLDLDLDNGVVRQVPFVVKACAELDGAATPMRDIEVRLALVHGEPVASDLLGIGNLPHGLPVSVTPVHSMSYRQRARRSGSSASWPYASSSAER
jgi:hypothetical protein